MPNQVKKTTEECSMEEIKAICSNYHISSKGLISEFEEYIRFKNQQGSLSNEETMMNISKMVSLGQLAATMIHELKQPLNSMSVGISTLELLLKEDNYDKNAVNKVLTSMKNQVLQSSNLMVTVSDFNRGYDLGKTSINMESFMDSVYCIIEKELLRVGIEVETKIQKDLPCLYADKIKMQQLLINLILNAKDAIEEKKQKSEEFVQGKILIEIKYKKRMKQICISIQDNGIGMESKIREKIFTPFFSTKEKGKGTGLGMVIIKKIIDQLNGKIEVNSKYAVGTNFIINIPV